MPGNNSCFEQKAFGIQGNLALCICRQSTEAQAAVRAWHERSNKSEVQIGPRNSLNSWTTPKQINNVAAKQFGTPTHSVKRWQRNLSAILAFDLSPFLVPTKLYEEGWHEIFVAAQETHAHAGLIYELTSYSRKSHFITFTCSSIIRTSPEPVMFDQLTLLLDLPTIFLHLSSTMNARPK